MIPKVRHFDKGVFFTICKPDLSDEELIVNNYIHYSNRYLNKIQCAFAFHVNDLYLIKIFDKYNRDVWEHAGDIDLNQIDFKIIVRRI
jgi:hypothetical protein